MSAKGKRDFLDLIYQGKRFIGAHCATDTFDTAGNRLEIVEEWYAFRDYQPDLHVLTVLETQDMAGPHYQRPPFPNTWARMHGQDRVFYTALGHRENVWTSTTYQSLLLAGSWRIRTNRRGSRGSNRLY
jgi:uncharacterized protein